MHAKYQVAIINIAKVMTNVKVFGRTNGRTDGRTDRLMDSSTAICHPTGGIKKAYSTAHKFKKKYIFTFRQFLFTSIAKK